jgi:hypothetical protein
VQDIELDMDFMAELEELSAIPCDAYAKCGLEALWSARTACCGDVLLLCDEHHEALLSVMEKKILTECGKCHSIGSFNMMISTIERL